VKTSFSVARTGAAAPRADERAVDRSVAATRAKAADEVRRLLAAAEAVLARTGYDGLRVDDVLAEAGLSTRAFYRHFAGKSELFLALFDRETDRAQERLRARVEREPTPDTQVRAWIAGSLGLAYDARLAPRTRLFALDGQLVARAFPAETEQCVASQLQPLVAAVARGRDVGAFVHADPERDARAIHHVCAGLMRDRLLGIGTLTRDDAIALATGVALQFLHADGRQRRPAKREEPTT
jgi:AcrR family transcriptional regulator